MVSAFTISLVCVLATYIFFLSRKKSRTLGSLPPGPKPVPLLGNVLDLTAQELWLRATQWSKQYGDVTYLHVFGQGLVFISSPEAASDLLIKKGGLYADKPQLVMVGELCGCENMVAFTPYGAQSKRQRKLLNSAFGVPTIPSYHPLITTSTHTFLRSLITAPESFVPHARVYAGSLTLSVVYGYQPQGPTDPMLTLAEECVDLLANRIASGGGIWPVDIFPSLKHYPEWLPGGSFLTKARAWKRKMEEFVDKPYEYLKGTMKSGNYAPSFCSQLLEAEDKQTEEFQFDLKWTANSMYGASIDTTMTAVSHFILAMIQHPEAMRKAQEEIDRVVGNERLPTFEDRPNLPYSDALLNEVYRWSVPVPLGLPHRLMEDDVYNGMHIPKGSLVFSNIWSITRNESIYPNAESFLPERFLEPVANEAEFRRRDPRSYVFGFGRRRCPGANLVESSVWLLMVSMLATLHIGKAKDDTGKEMEPEVKFENSVFRTPSEYKCDIRPRSPQAIQLIRETL